MLAEQWYWCYTEFGLDLYARNQYYIANRIQETLYDGGSLNGGFQRR